MRPAPAQNKSPDTTVSGDSYICRSHFAAENGF